MNDEAMQALRQRALESDQCIRSAWTKVSKRSMEIGYEGAFLRRYDLWAFIGYESETAYWTSVGISKSTWYQTTRIAESFPDMEKETYLRMTIENAEELSKHPEVLQDPVLIEAACTMTKAQLEHRLLVEKATRENRPVAEQWVAWKMKMPQSAKEVILSKLRRWQKDHGIEDEAYALELLLAEVTDHATLVGFMQESIVRLSQAVTQATSEKQLYELRSLFAAHIQDMGEMLRICCSGSEKERAA